MKTLLTRTARTLTARVLTHLETTLEGHFDVFDDADERDTP